MDAEQAWTYRIARDADAGENNFRRWKGKKKTLCVTRRNTASSTAERLRTPEHPGKKKPQVSSFTGTKLMKRHASHASQAGLRVWLCGVKTFTKTMITATEKKTRTWVNEYRLQYAMFS